MNVFKTLNVAKVLILYGCFMTSALFANDTIIYKSQNGRSDSKLIRNCSKDAYSDHFIQSLFESKHANEYQLFDSLLIVDKKDTFKIAQNHFKIGLKYVSANLCHHQRNYSLHFVKVNYDTYNCFLEILTDSKIKTHMQFKITLIPSVLLGNGNIVYKDQNSNLKITQNGENTILLENLFIDNQACPRTIMFIK